MSVFFDLRGAGRLENHDVLLLDSNPDLMGCYECVRDAPDAVAAALRTLAAAHARRGNAHYYEVRDRRFNPLRRALRRDGGQIAYTAELAAMLLYLNRTGFNGLVQELLLTNIELQEERIAAILPFCNPAILQSCNSRAAALLRCPHCCGSADRPTVPQP